MRIKKKNPHIKPIVISVIIAVIIISLGVGFYLLQRKGSTSDTKRSTDSSKNTTTSELDKDKSSTKDDTDTPTESSSVDSSQKNQKPSSTTIPEQKVEGASLIIASASQQNGSISIKAQVSGVNPGGQCVVYFTSETTRDVKSLYLNQTQSGNTIACSGNWPESQFTSIGKHTVRVVYITPQNQSVEQSTTMEIQ